MTQAVAAGTVAAILACAPTAQADLTWPERRIGVRYQTWLWPRDAFTYREDVQIVTAAALRLGVDAAKARAVADCESGFWHRAVSASGTYRGLFQHHADYWAGRVAGYRGTWGKAHPKLQIRLGANVLHPRPNALVAMWMVRGSGWGAWACA